MTGIFVWVSSASDIIPPYNVLTATGKSILIKLRSWSADRLPPDLVPAFRGGRPHCRGRIVYKE
jgi:hypothetical protein